MGKITPKGTGKNKTYTARAWWTDIRGERHSKQESGFTTQKAAQEWINETETKNEGLAFPEAHKLVMSSLASVWLGHLRDIKRSPKTLEWYELQISKINEYLGPVLVQELQFLHIQKMFDELRQKPIKIAPRKSKLPPEKRKHKSEAKSEDEKLVRLPRSETIYSTHRTLRAMLNYALKMGIIKVSPCQGIDLPETQKHIAHIYSGEDLTELMSLLKQMRHPLYIPIILTVPYALRRGEAIGIAWDAVDFEDKCIRIERNWTIAYGKALLKSVKNEASDSTVALSDWTIDELRALQKERFAIGKMTIGKTLKKDVVYEKDIVVSDFLCWDENNKLFRPDGMTKRLQRFQKANHLPLCTWHDLRHTYGTLMAEDGQDVVAISKAMRHSSVKITSDQYIEGTMNIKRRATAAFENVIKMPTKENKNQDENFSEK